MLRVQDPNISRFVLPRRSIILLGISLSPASVLELHVPSRRLKEERHEEEEEGGEREREREREREGGVGGDRWWGRP
ncbi:hypothetical protein RHGRI_011489 [Rhododendron griersonianum]|uniref:Uncharacterized protein n=1 Tax=Rhododendron griersonianum TaxID=479676 RepID=A0AAV6KMI1_9ERIC|nr:hypothetical protein RHGRI_011489 [Rhododendron griersonianum]